MPHAKIVTPPPVLLPSNGLSAYNPGAPASGGGGGDPGGGGTTGGGGVTFGANVAALDTAMSIGIVAIGTWPDREHVLLVRDTVANKWVSLGKSLISQSDLAYMGTNTSTLSYIGTNVSGSATGGIGWATKPIRRVAELLTAGLSLQAAASGIMVGQPGQAFSVRARFFGHNDGETVAFSSDGSTALAEIPVVASAASTAIVFKAPGWTDVLKIGTGVALAAADVTKANLWPRLYGSIPSGGYGSQIDWDLQYRWVA